MRRLLPLVPVLLSLSRLCALEVERVFPAVDTFPRVTGVISLACNDQTGRLYYAGTDSGVVMVVDADTCRRLNAIHVGSGVADVALCPARDLLYVACNGQSGVTVVDCGTEQVRQTVATAAPVWKFAYFRSCDKLYCALSDTALIEVIDCAHDSVVARIGIAAPVVSLMQDSTQNRLLGFCKGASGSYLAAIDCGGDTICWTTLLDLSWEFSADYSQASDVVYYANLDDTLLVAVDGSTGAVREDINLGGWPLAVACDDTNSLVYVSFWAETADVCVLVVYDGAAHRVVAETPMFDFTEGNGNNEALYLHYSAATDRVYAFTDWSWDGPGTTDVFDAQTGSLLWWSVSLFREEYEEPAVCDQPSRHRVFVAGEDPDVIDVFRARPDMVEAEVVNGYYPWSAALMAPGGGRLYCMTWFPYMAAVNLNPGGVSDVFTLADWAEQFDVNRKTGRLYCVNEFRRLMSVVDLASATVTNVAVDSGVLSVCCDAARGRVYCAVAPDSAVVVYDGSDNRLLASIRLPGQPQGLCYHSGADRVFCVAPDSPGSSIVAAINCGSLALEDTATLPSVLESPFATNGMVYFEALDSLVALDPYTLAEVGRVRLRSWSFERCYNPSTDRLYCFARYAPGAWIEAMDCRTNSLDSAVQLPGYDWTAPLCCDTAGDVVYYTCGTKAIFAFDGTTRRVIDSVTLSGKPAAAALNVLGDRLYVAMENGDIAELRGLYKPTQPVRPRQMTIARGELYLLGQQKADLYDAAGRRIGVLRPGRNSLSGLAAGVYFVRRPDATGATKIVVAR